MAPNDPQFQARQTELLHASLRKADADSNPQHRIFFVGLAMYSEAWSENDVVDFAQELARVAPSFTVVPLILSNAITGLPDKFPVVTLDAIQQTLERVARLARADDLVMIFVSTHGARGRLAQKVGIYPATPVTGPQLRQALAPLVGHRTIIVLSACFSGSLIQELREPDWVVITAARADRASFGCQANADHTVFGKALLDAFAQSGQSLSAIFMEVRTEVSRLEQQRHYSPPSEPQVFVGSDMIGLYEQPIL